jgi:heme-degrading monooxygenase HmoA
MGVVSVLGIRVRPGAEAEFMRSFLDLAVFDHARRSGGFRGGRVLRPLADGEPFLVVADWDDAASYQGWLDNPMRAELNAKIEPLVAESVPGGGLYEEVAP